MTGFAPIPNADDDAGAEASFAIKIGHPFIYFPFLFVPSRRGVVQHLPIVHVQDSVLFLRAVIFWQPYIHMPRVDMFGWEIFKTFDGAGGRSGCLLPKCQGASGAKDKQKNDLFC